MGLYRPAVSVYCWFEELSLKIKNTAEYLRSPFINAAFMKRKELDCLPFPPVRLVYLVTNTYRYEWFFETGTIGSQCIRSILEKNNMRIDAFASILDFGCGCGRIIRHWKQDSRLCGSDYNPVLAGWCRENLPFAEFTVNGLASKLIYADETFDFIYAISVFTHLTEELGFFWMKELGRVLRPGGVMYLTFMGTTRAPHLRTELREQFEKGRLVVTGEEFSGGNRCAVYHPEKYVREILAKEFHVLDFIPGGARDANQDVFLLQKTL